MSPTPEERRRRGAGPEHIEYFHDHARLEQMLLAGVPTPQGDVLAPDPGAAGLGLALRPEAEPYRVAHHSV